MNRSLFCVVFGVLFFLSASFQSSVLVSGTSSYSAAAWGYFDCASTSQNCCRSGSTAYPLTITTSPWTTVKLDSDYVAPEIIQTAISWKGYRGDRLTVQCPPGYAVPSGQNVYAQCDWNNKKWYVRTATGSLTQSNSGVLGSCQPQQAVSTIGPFPSSTYGSVRLSWTDSSSQTLNSYITTSTFRGYHNDEVTITCNSGYTRNGPATTRCDNNRITPQGWNSGELASCTPTPAAGCPTQLRLVPTAVATTKLKTSVTGSQYYVGQTIPYGNGYYTGKVGEEVTVTCATDCQYGATSPSTAKCLSTGWSTPPVCLPKACYNRIPITPAGTGVVNLTKTYADQEDIGAIDPPATFQGYVGDEVKLTCKPGFTPNGPTSATCAAGTTGWGSNCALGACVPNVCPNSTFIPSLLIGVTTIVSTFWNGNDTGIILGTPSTPGASSTFRGRVGDIISLRCNAGLTLTGSATATCTSSGWTPIGSCVLACTGTLNAPTNGFITVDQYANSANPTKYSSIVNPDASKKYYVGCNDPTNYQNVEYTPIQPIVFPTTYPGGNQAYAFGVHWDFGTAAYNTYKLNADGTIYYNNGNPVAQVKEGAVNPTLSTGGVVFADSSTIGAPKINLKAWGLKSRVTPTQPMVPYSPGPVPLSGTGSYSWNNAGNLNTSPPAANLISLALKEEGVGETGLGLTGHSQLEILRDQWITFDLKPLRDAGFGNVNFAIQSVQDNEGYAIWGSQNLGSPGQLLYVGTSSLGVSSQYIVADDVPSAAAPYRYISVSTQGYMSGSTMSWSNVLISPVSARGITSCAVPTLLECTRKGNSGVNGDPQFSGLQGQSFQFHGIPDEVFNLITTPSLQVNSHFKYISAGTCTYKETQCWTHPGTYLDEVGLMIGSGVRIHVVSGAHAHGLRVFIDGEEKYAEPDLLIDLAEDANVTTAIVKFTKHNAVTIVTDLFDIELVNSDYFFNLGVVLKNRHIVSAGRPRRVIPSNVCKAEAAVRASHKESHSHENSPVRHDLLHHYPDLPIHGLVGQTWKNAVYCGASFEGSVDDYVAGSLWGTDFTFNQYTVDADRLMPQSEQENEAQLHHI